jgi:DNA-binding SARP family transcriptional activator
VWCITFATEGWTPSPMDTLAAQAPITLQLLGAVDLRHAEKSLNLPASRKTRALLAFLAITGKPQRRERLCELLWDMTDDPRAALRWSLAKLRPLLAADGIERLMADRDMVKLDTQNLEIDVAQLRWLASPDVLASLSTDALQTASEQFAGDFLEGSEVDHASEFRAWVAAAREDCRSQQRRLLTHLIDQLPDRPGDRLATAQRLIRVDPFDEDAYAACVAALMELGRADEAATLAQTATAMLHRERIGLSGALVQALKPIAVPRPALLAAPTPRRQQPSLLRDKHVVATIAVLPFATLGPEAESRKWLVDGLIDGVTDALSRYVMLRVLAPGAAAKFRAMEIDPIEVANALCADYLLSYRLIVGRTGAVAWSGSIERPFSDAIALQDETAAEIANAIEPQIVSLRLSQSAEQPEVDLVAYDYFLRGFAAAFASGPKDYPGAIDAFEKALAVQPGFAPALAYLPWARGMAFRLQTPEQFADAISMARTAVFAAGADARTLGMGAMTLVMLGQDYDTGLKAVDRALRLNPNDPFVLTCSGWIRATAGEFDTPMEHFERSVRLNPLAHVETGNVHAGRAMCCLLAEHYGDARNWADAALAMVPNHPSALFSGTAAAMGLGDTLDAKNRAAAFMAVMPWGLDSPVVKALPFRRKGDRDRIFGLLRAAGLPG